MSGVDELVAFLRAALDRDEQVARGATQGAPWRIEGSSIVGRSWRASESSPETLVVKHTWPQEAEHIVRWDPARVLAEVAFKRRILDRHARVLERGNWAWFAGSESESGEELRALAQPYAGQPGWRAEWAA